MNFTIQIKQGLRKFRLTCAKFLSVVQMVPEIPLSGTVRASRYFFRTHIQKAINRMLCPYQGKFLPGFDS